MTEKDLTEEEAIHRQMAIDLFNFTWTLLDKEKRSVEENDDMIHAAHASRFHWGKVGTPVHLERGEWQISRVYSALIQPQAALYHARRCLEICQENNIGDFDIAFAYEALARAYSIEGNEAEKTKYFELAVAAAEKIKEADDKDYFLGELKSI